MSKEKLDLVKAIALGIVVGSMLGVVFLLACIKTQLYEQFRYEVDADLCFEQARLVQSYCHVERDEDGSYSWYFIPYEAGSEPDETTVKVLSPAEVVELWES